MPPHNSSRDDHDPSATGKSAVSPQVTKTSHKASSTSLPGLRQSASIRFSEETNTASRSSMNSRQGTSSADEITPIRHADGNTERNYRTSEESPGVSSRTGGVSKAPQTPGSRVPIHEDAEPGVDQKESWYKRIVSKYGSVTLDNKGSVARDHLALERTFLAWLRTSLAFASIGIAVTQLFRLNTSLADNSTALQVGSNLPFAPLLGHAVPVELLPYLQQIANDPIPSFQQHTLGPTLLDQLLLLPPADAQSNADSSQSVHTEASASKMRHLGRPLGATFIGISIVVLLVGFHRYFESQYWIIRGKFPASRGSIALVGSIAGALIIASLIVLSCLSRSNLTRRGDDTFTSVTIFTKLSLLPNPEIAFPSYCKSQISSRGMMCIRH